MTSTGSLCQTVDDELLSEQPSSTSGSPAHAALARLAAKARIVETLSSGDVRVLAAELREGLEVLCGPTADVVSILGRR